MDHQDEAEQERLRGQEEGRAALRALKPWGDGPAGTGDKVLLGVFAAMIVLGLATKPAVPFLIAHHPVVLELLTGSKSSIGAGAAFARIGRVPLWLVVVAGVVGAMKLDWVVWLMGRRWGDRIVRLFAGNNERFLSMVDRADELPRWLAPVAVLVGVLPGVPAALAYAFAGWQRLRLGWFLVCNVLSTALVVGLVAGLGYGLGQRAVDIVLMVDDYALWVSLAIIIGGAVWSSVRATRAQKAAGDRSVSQEPGEPG